MEKNRSGGGDQIDMHMAITEPRGTMTTGQGRRTQIKNIKHEENKPLLLLCSNHNLNYYRKQQKKRQS